ncbi:GNAT family N-acetyltransferase [Kribbella qitaiheensis]|uniref:GNAT family N-acetyltransferase n=1 Tax=Kribbella qitaiheensis TaxID=1544730 RepID=A0A7G6WWR7_9ACTN|nr:GNAT family N-acetyltransferase [Kribbella qitaiheensis]QNE18432.1 GNAT family N-acetyltransferase [Kribbella qitaiheensis]
MLVKAWAEGWAIARGTAAPVEVADGYRIDVGLPGHVARYVLPAHSPALAARLTTPGTWMKICGPAPVLDERWQVQALEYLMSAQLTAEPPRHRPEYELQLTRVGSVLDVVVSSQGEPAARGRAGLAGEYAVIDQVVTEPGHRRRGLGTTVMRALSQAASHSGARTGVLVATADGLALYSRLGWALVSPVTAARL